VSPVASAQHAPGRGCRRKSAWCRFTASGQAGRRCGARHAFYCSSVSSRYIRIRRAASRLPPRRSFGFLPFLPRCGAVISTFITSTLLFLALTTLQHFFFFLSRYSPASTYYPFRSGTALFPPSCPSVAFQFPPGAETPPRPITEDVLLRPHILRIIIPHTPGPASFSRKRDAGPISPRVR
jgi:hypothetical protein